MKMLWTKPAEAGAVVIVDDRSASEVSADAALPSPLHDAHRAILALEMARTGKTVRVFAHPRWFEGSALPLEYRYSVSPRPDREEEEHRVALIKTAAGKGPVAATALAAAGATERRTGRSPLAAAPQGAPAPGALSLVVPRDDDGDPGDTDGEADPS